VNELERELEQRLSMGDDNEAVQSLRSPILATINRELRTRRRDRLATRVVLAGFLLAIVGNWAISRHESARMARWFPNATHAPLAFADDETMLAEDNPPIANTFEQYLLAYYPPHSIATNSRAARETASWLEEINHTGRGL